MPEVCTQEFAAAANPQGAGAARVRVAIIGASGRVGSRLVELVGSWRGQPRLLIVAAANSTRGTYAADGIAATELQSRLATSAYGGGMAFADSLGQHELADVVVDCTASDEIAGYYPRWLHAGIDVVTPNKCGPSADRALAGLIGAAQAATSARLHANTTVGAQLPVLSTLRELHLGGDRIQRFEAVLSGTLSFVLGRIHQGVALSAAVGEAITLGYAEPNPARDLSGEDAARKLVILLRALGHELELGDVECAPLVEAGELDAADPAKTLAGLGKADEYWRARAAIAEARRERWVYRASFEDGRARVGPELLAETHPLARLAPCENALIVHSAYYRAAPLTIAGPGAGVELTAAGVFADLLAATRRHRAVSPPAPREEAEAFAAVA